MTEQFTLITFHRDEVDLENPRSGPTELSAILDATQGHRVKIDLGMYVYDTQKGWQNIHLLCEWLRTRKRIFLRLPFEEELFLYTTPVVAKALSDMGVKALLYPTDSPTRLYQ